MKARFTAHKLEEASVSHISLVARGANRAPFKIIKRDKEQEMIDLSKFIKRGSAKEQKAVCIGYVLPKDALTDSVLKALKDSGIDTDKREEADGAVLFKTSDEKYEENEVTIMKMCENYAVMVKGFDPYKNVDKMSFSEVLKAQGFMPGVSMATSSLYDTIRAALQSDDQAEAVKKIETILDEFKGYVKQIASDIPAIAFKAEAAIEKALAEEGVKEKTDKSDDGEKKKTPEEMAAAGASDEEITAAHGMTAEQVAALRKTDTNKGEGDKGVDVDAIVAAVTKSLSGVVTEQIGKAVGELPASVKAMQKTLDGVVKAQGDITTKLEAVEATAKKAERAASAMVIGGAGAGDDAHNTLRKSEDEDEGSLGIIDTAFQPNVRKSAQRRVAGSR